MIHGCQFLAIIGSLKQNCKFCLAAYSLYTSQNALSKNLDSSSTKHSIIVRLFCPLRWEKLGISAIDKL